MRETVPAAAEEECEGGAGVVEHQHEDREKTVQREMEKPCSGSAPRLKAQVAARESMRVAAAVRASA